MADRTLDVDLIRQLAELLDKTSLTEIEVEDAGVRIRVARTAAPAAALTPTVVHHAAPAAAPPASTAPAAAEIGASAPAPATVNAVKSPMVGTVYLSAEPGSKPFATPGQKVAAGDTLVIIEAMKVMNPITAPSAGTIREVLVGNGQPVEFDQPLVVFD